MIRNALSILTIVFVSSLLIAADLKSSENIDFTLPERAANTTHSNNKLLNSSIDTCSDSAPFACATEKKLKMLQHDQDLMDLQREANMKIFLKGRG